MRRVRQQGLDIEGLEYVVNFNLPYLAEDYVHRIGRAGRAGQKGHAISFVSREEERSLANIQRMIGQKIKRIHRPGFEVNYRDELVKKMSDQKRPIRLNKSTTTVIKKTPDKGVKKGKPGTKKTTKKKS